MTETVSTPKIGSFDLSAKPKGRSLGQDAWARLIRNKASIIGMIIIGFFTLVAIFASVIVPHSPIQIHSGKNFLPPAWVKDYTGKSGDPDYLLGTDALGRDILSRVI